VDAAADIGLGDDERVRLEIEVADLGRQRHELAAAPQHEHLGVLKETEACFIGRRKRAGLHVAVEAVLAHAEERDVASFEPLQERDGLLAHGSRNACGCRFQIGDGLLEPRQHGSPVADGCAHFLENILQGGDDRVAFRGCEAGDVGGDVAFLAPVAPALVAAAENARQPAVGRALAFDQRMQHEVDGEPACVQLRGDAVHEEGHVRIEDLDRSAISPEIANGHLGRANRLLLQEGHGVVDHRGDGRGRAVGQHGLAGRAEQGTSEGEAALRIRPAGLQGIQQRVERAGDRVGSLSLCAVRHGLVLSGGDACCVIQ
jgi:hypothetical protein